MGCGVMPEEAAGASVRTMSSGAARAARPFVVAHVAVSLDGATTGFPVDVGRYYEVAAIWREDVTLTGADTVLAQEQVLATAPRPGPAKNGPLLAVVDSRGRVSAWEALRTAGYWSDVLAVRAESSPPGSADPAVPELVAGADRVDLAATLTALGRREGVGVVRVDSGGSLLGALLDAGLVDELSLLVHPCLVAGPGEHRWYGSVTAPAMFACVATQRFDGGVVWLRYRLAQVPGS